LKQLDADYQQVDQGSIPVIEQQGATVRVIVGEGSPLQLHTAVRYLDVSLEQGSEFIEPLPAGYQGVLYVVSGLLQCNGEQVKTGNAIYIEQGDSEIQVRAEQPSRFMFCIGQPHHEPIRQWGPFVD
jgi:hypothetical protein